MNRATNGDVELAYAVDGPADGEPVVFIEGLGYGRWMWRWQRDALNHVYRTIIWDNRGTGDSDVPEGPYSIAEMAGDLEAVLEDAGVERAHVVGASMGGMIAQQYALEYDRAATVSLLCTTPGGSDAVPVPEETQERMFATPEGADERELIRHRMAPAVSETFFEDNPERAERIVDWRVESDASDAAKQAQAAGVYAFDVADRLEDLDRPTQILHGSEDRVVPVENARLLEESIPDTDLEILEGGHHLFFIENAPWVADRLRAFFSDHRIEVSDATGDSEPAGVRAETDGPGDDE